MTFVEATEVLGNLGGLLGSIDLKGNARGLDGLPVRRGMMSTQ